VSADLTPEVQGSLDAQTLAFVRAIARFHPERASVMEGELVDWAVDQLRASVERVHTAIEHTEAIDVGDVDEALAPGANCPGCGGQGRIVPLDCQCDAPTIEARGCPHTPDVCPVCGGSGRLASQPRHTDPDPT
jgi:hypothetical protein